MYGDPADESRRAVVRSCSGQAGVQQTKQRMCQDRREKSKRSACAPGAQATSEEAVMPFWDATNCLITRTGPSKVGIDGHKGPETTSPERRELSTGRQLEIRSD